MVEVGTSCVSSCLETSQQIGGTPSTKLARQTSDQTVDWQDAKLSNNTIVISGLQRRARHGVKTWLAELVPLTGETVLARREEVAQAAAKIEADEPTADEAAQTLTEWFRSDT